MADVYDQLLDDQQPTTEPVAPVQGGDAYDAILNEFDAQQDAALKQSLGQALKVLPQQAATTQQLAKASGLPADLVERNKDVVQQQVKLKELQSLLSASPILARQMQDPQFAKLAHSDANTLSTIEKLWRQPTGGAVEGLGMGTAGIGDTLSILQRNFMEGFSRTFLPEPIGGWDKVDKGSIAGPLVGADWQKVGEYLKAQGRDIQIPQLQQDFWDKVLAGLGQVGAQVGVSLATGPVGSGAFLYGQGVNMMTEKTKDDPASQGAKDLAALLGGGVTAVTEKWALDKLLGPMTVPIQNQLGAALARIGIAGASEGAQETIESLAQDSLRQFLTNPDAEIQVGQAFEEGGIGATVGAIVRTVVESAAGIRSRAIRTEQQAAQAEQNTAMIEQLNQLAAASELLKTSPETFQQFIEAAAEDGDVQDVYIDAQFLMQSGMADQLAQVSPAIAQQLPVALATGGTVQIPVGEYAAKIAPTEFAQGLLDHLKTDPMGFSRAEAQEYFQTQQQQLEQEIAQQLEAKAGDQEFMDSKERVKQTVLTELNNLGRFTPQKNELDATLIAARTAVRAAQLGMTPEAFFEKQRLSFVAERIDGDTFSQDGQLQTDTPAFKNWFGDSKVVDEQGKPLVVYHGTTKDFESFDPSRSKTTGIFFSAKPDYANIVAELDGAREGGARVIPAYVSVKNPMYVNSREFSRADTKRALAEGFDGLITLDDDGKPSQITVFEPTQIKSAVGNRGTFDPNNPNILMQGGQLQTDTPAFKNWFGNSKVVDEQGKPLVVYHGTGADFSAFSLDKAGSGTDTGMLGKGFYFSTDPEYASRYAKRGESPNVVPVYVALKNPLVTNNLRELPAMPEPQTIEEMEIADVLYSQQMRDALLSQGYDGVIYETPDGKKEVVAFEPTQIKSAVGNRGTFDPNDPNILMQSAYHGTPHSFDKFSLDAIGTGEGAQVYGWGLYFAGNKEIAEWYRDTLTEARAKVTFNTRFEVGGNVVDPSDPDYANLKGIHDAGGFDTYIKSLQTYLESADQNHPIYKVRAKILERTTNLREKYNNAKLDFITEMEKEKADGTLYQVDIPEDDDLLDYSAKFKDQPEKVRQAIAKLFNDIGQFDLLVTNPTGVDIYNFLSEAAMEGRQFDAVRKFENKDAAMLFYKEKMAEWRGNEGAKTQPTVDQDFDGNWEIRYGQNLDEMFGIEPNISADRTASLVLDKAGIPGLRYQDGMSRNGEGNTFNYVIWDENAVTVEAVNDELIQAQQQTFKNGKTYAVDTPAFKNWFGNSKVVDDQGKPKVMYHGTAADFSEFAKPKAQDKDGRRMGMGWGKGKFYFADSGQAASSAAEFAQMTGRGKQQNVMPVYLKIDKPIMAEDYMARVQAEIEKGKTRDQAISVVDKAIRKEGFDGIIDEKSGGHAVFEPTQIKSAIGNRGTFDPNDPNILFQSNPVVDPERNLYVAHNIRPEGILAAADLGGLAAPSIAVARADIGFENFGEVTLIADPSLLTSSKVRTFDADIYSPRQPRAEYDINEKKWWTFSTELESNGLGLSRPDINSVERDGPQTLLQSDAVRYLFLKEQSKLPKMKQRQVETAIKQAAKLTGDRWALIEDPKFLAIATKRYQEYVRQAEASDPVRGEKYTSLFFEADGTLQRNTLMDFARKVVDYRDSGGKDIGQFRNDLNTKLRDGKLAADYQKWVEDKFNSMVDGKQIFKGFTNSGNRKYIPYTLENVVKEMTQTLQAGEGSFYGAGSVRSSVANEMKTIAQVQARRNQIVSEADLEKVKEESNQKLEDALEALKPFYKYDTDGWSYFNDAGAAIAEGPKAQREAFKITPQSQKIIDDLLNYLRELPTAYFEAKAQRAVQFNEFNTAVVPKGMRKDALQVLKDAGLKIKTYDPKVEGDRSRIIAEQSKLLFQGKLAPRGAFNPNTNTIAMMKGADLSTFLHEAGHYFFESDIVLANEIAQGNALFGAESMTQGESEILNDVGRLFTWFGFEGDVYAQLATWNGLSFEQKRAYHEKTAESFERYLFEGKAPSIELQSYFQQFRAWLVNVYKSIKDFITRNPAAGELTDEVRAVFDRMLATTEEIQLAEQARSMMPLFRTQADADNIGMTPEEFRAYQKDDVATTNDAIQDMQARAVRDLQWTRRAHNREVKRLQRQAAELRKEIKDEAKAQVLQEPVYKAWQFLTRKLEDSDRVTPIQRPKSDPNVVDPMIDSMFTAIAKLGGLNKQEAMETWGAEEADRPNSGVFGKPVLRVNGGKSIDGMVEALAQYGYLPLDENGKADVADFETKFDDELRGDPQYSVAYDYSIDDALMLRPGEQMDLSSLTAGRLDMGALMEMNLTSAEIELLKARRMTAKDGLHPDLVAELPGIEMTSGDELVRKLLAATPLKEEIEARAETIMLERHGELASPEAIEREADKAIHNEARAKMVATEANALARATGERKILAQAAKSLAQTMVARVKVRDLKPTQYASAGARAAKNAVKASNEGDLRKAAAEKRNQLVNTYATQAAYNAQDEINAALRYLKKFDKEGSRKGLDVDYLEQIDTLLERFDLRKGQSLKTIDKRTSLAKWIAAQEEAGIEPDLPEYVTAEAYRIHYKNMTVEEFRGLVDSIKQIEHLGRLKKKLLTAKDERELDAIVETIKERIEKSSGGRVVNNEVRNTWQDKTRVGFAKFLMAHRKAASVARELDGFEDGGPMWEYFTRSMNEAGDYEVTKRAETAQKLHDLAKPILEGEEMGGKGRFFPSLNRSLNRGERIAIALNWGNDSNRQRLLGGKGWTAAQVQPVLDTLTAQEWQFVQGIWDLFESFRPEIAAKEKRVSGKEPDWIEAVPLDVTTSDGQRLQLRGGYYPVKYDPRQSGKAGEHAEAEEAKQMMRAAYTAATTRRSFTKSRAAEVYDRPLLLSFDGIYQGMNEVIHDLAWHEWLIDANKLMRRLDGTIRTSYGADYVDTLKRAVKDIAVGDTPAANAVESALGHVRNGSTIVGMGWNLTTAAMQPLGYAQSVVRIGGKWMARGMTEFFGSPSKMIAKAEEVNSKSKLMANRALTLNREINDVRNRLETSKSETYQRIEATFFIMIQKMQALVDYPTWLGAYDKALADPANDEARAIALADQAVLDAQGGGQTKDLALVQRGGPLLKLFTNFYSYFNVLYNLTSERTKQRVQAKEYGGLLTDYTLLMIVPAVMSAVIRNALKGEDDEDEYAKAIAGELVGYPFGMFLGVREIAEAAKLASGLGNPGLGYSGPAGLRFFSEVNKFGAQIGQGELDWALFKAANNVAGILFHYPAGQVNRMVEGTAALIDGKTENPLAPLVGVQK